MTAEICAGIVKTTPLHSKVPAQHFHDLNEIETILMCNQLSLFASLERERQKIMFVLMVVMMRAPVISKSSFGGHATIWIEHLKFSFLQHITVAQVTKAGWSSKMCLDPRPL